jgi:3',5'-cyclic AMP phosphodiesterase CpdA
MGQGLVIEGPSGIGKTTAINKAREAIAPSVPYRRVRSLVPGDLLALDEALSSGFTGHLFIDDFHHLDEARMRSVASAIKVLADDSRDDAKITVIGINPVGVSLMHNFPDLAGRFDRVSMTRQPDPCIAELITRGEAAANVTFLRRDELINAAAGSFFTAQQLCFHACVHAGIDETQPTRTEIDVGVHAVLDAVMDSLDNKYHDRLRNFSAWDRTLGRPGAFLALLWLLSRDREGFVSVVEASLQFPKLEEAFAWLGAGNLEGAFAGIPGLTELFYFNARAGVLTAEDPQLVFYLSHMSWTDFARRSGHAHVRLDPGGLLVFAGPGPATAGPAERASGESMSSLPPSSVLHLSDLHFGSLEQATLWYGQLAEDLRELGCARLDAAILSGDISNRAAPGEYDAARALLTRLMAEFGLSEGRIVVVPGNHDLSWPLARSAYRLERRADHPGPLTDGLYIDRGEIVEVRNEEAYRRRFEPFSAFHGAVRGQPYPLEYAQQAILQHLPEQKLLFLGLNSAWQLDHHFTLRAAIHGGALSDALFRIRTTPEYAGCLKIAVWHHPISGDGDDRLRDTGFLEQLAKAGFRLALHGHIHKARNELFRYDMSAGDRRLDLVCAGTFGAPVNEWVPGYPLGYNLLRFGRGKVIVETRRREELDGAWKPDARWLRGPGADPQPRYEIQL